MVDHSTVHHYFYGWNNWVTLASILNSDTFIEEQSHKVIKTRSRMSSFWFCHFMTVLIVHIVTWTIVMAAVSTHDYQQSRLSGSLLNSTGFVSNQVRFITLKSIYSEVNIVDMWQIRSRTMEIQILSFSLVNIWTRPQGSHIYTNCHY